MVNDFRFHHLPIVAKMIEVMMMMVSLGVGKRHTNTLYAHVKYKKKWLDD